MAVAGLERPARRRLNNEAGAMRAEATTKGERASMLRKAVAMRRMGTPFGPISTLPFDAGATSR